MQTEIRYDTGFGLIHRNIMRDKNLSIESKGIYSYISSFAGTSGQAYPGVKLMCTELNISENRFHKFKNELVEKGYLTIERERREKGFSKNIYTLHVQPVTRQFVGIQNVGIQNVGIQNEVTNNNSINNNSINNNKINNTTHTADEQKVKELFDFYQDNNFGQVTPYLQETILKWVDDLNEEGQGYDLVIAALKIAVEAKAYNFKYAKTVLTTWYNSRIFNIEAARAHEKSRMGKTINKTKQPEKSSNLTNNGGKRSRFDKEATYGDVYTQKELEEMAAIGGVTVEEIIGLKVYQRRK